MPKTHKKLRTPKERIPDKGAKPGGYFVQGGIVTFRCQNKDCEKHMSLAEYEIYENGEVQPTVVCPYCGDKYENLVLDGHDANFVKAKGEVELDDKRLWKKNDK